MECIKQLLKKLSKVEKELEKVRGVSPLSDGWQTQKLAKKQRKWDYYAKIKIELLNKIFEAETTKLLNTKTQEQLMQIKKLKSIK